MPGGRFLIMLIVVAAGLLTAALAISSGDGGSPTTQAGSAISGRSAAAGLDWGQAAGALAGAAAPTSRGETLSLLVGFLGGWLLRWAYALPWGSIPRAMLHWLLGWRKTAVMAGLAAGCTVILLFY